MRAHKRADSEPITADTFAQLYALLEREYPGKVWRVAEVCPVAVVKTIDNEADARATIANIELAKGPLAAGVASSNPRRQGPRQLVQRLRKLSPVILDAAPSPAGGPMSKPDYDTSIARMAGNIMSAYECYDLTPAEREAAAVAVVAMARAIVAEVKRTDPEKLGVDPLSSRTPESLIGPRFDSELNPDTILTQAECDEIIVAVKRSPSFTARHRGDQDRIVWKLRHLRTSVGSRTPEKE